jgi:hypothetical protein
VSGITLQAIFSRATTTVDGGWNITFAVSQEEAKAILQLAQMRDTLMQLACVPIEGMDYMEVSDEVSETDS